MFTNSPPFGVGQTPELPDMLISENMPSGGRELPAWRWRIGENPRFS
jgi:hypothetical protein